MQSFYMRTMKTVMERRLIWVFVGCTYQKVRFLTLWPVYLWWIDIDIITVTRENVFSGICGQRRPRSACASAQSDQDLHYPLKMYEESKGPVGTLRMRRMIWICAFCTCSKTRFRLGWPIQVMFCWSAMVNDWNSIASQKIVKQKHLDGQ